MLTAAVALSADRFCVRFARRPSTNRGNVRCPEVRDLSVFSVRFARHFGPSNAEHQDSAPFIFDMMDQQSNVELPLGSPILA
jgi:hypothetical protein